MPGGANGARVSPLPWLDGVNGRFVLAQLFSRQFGLAIRDPCTGTASQNAVRATTERSGEGRGGCGGEHHPFRRGVA